MRRKLEAHELLTDYIRLHEKLGRAPTRDEYDSDPDKRYSKGQIVEVFGSWINFTRAAGHIKHPLAREKRDKQEIRKRYYEHLIREVERLRTEVIERPAAARVLFIPDLHCPYHHPDAFEFLFALDDKYKFDRVICGGDEIDLHALSFHTHDPDLLSPGHELSAAIAALRPLYARFPVVDVLSSNHGSLIFRKGKHHGIPQHVIKPYREVLDAPIGWVWHDELVVEFSDGKKTLVHHGYSSNILQASQKRAMSLVQFHFHTKFSIQYWSNPTDSYFAMQSGCLIDDRSMAFSYNKLTLERPRLGASAVIDGHPILLPMHLDSSGRWTKKVP